MTVTGEPTRSLAGFRGQATIRVDRALFRLYGLPRRICYLRNGGCQLPLGPSYSDFSGPELAVTY